MPFYFRGNRAKSFRLGGIEYSRCFIGNEEYYAGIDPSLSIMPPTRGGVFFTIEVADTDTVVLLPQSRLSGTMEADTDLGGAFSIGVDVDQQSQQRLWRGRVFYPGTGDYTFIFEYTDIYSNVRVLTAKISA